MKYLIAAVVLAVATGIGITGIEIPEHMVEGGIPEAEPVSEMQPVEEPVEVWTDEQDYEEPYYDYEPEYVEPEPPEVLQDDGAPNLRRDGRVYAGGEEWTWYSENVLPGDGLDELNSNGRTVDDEGHVVDGDGYIAIASPDEGTPIGTIVETPWGYGKIYDYNDGSSYDVYVNW